MGESAKDLTTTAVGLIAAYFLPGATALGTLSWIRPEVRQFLTTDGEHWAVTVMIAIIISLLLNGLRVAVLSCLIFKEISFGATDFHGADKGRVTALQAAIDEVFRLHQFYSGLFFLLPFIIWMVIQWGPISTCKKWVVVPVLVLLWRMIGVPVLDTYEFYHQIARGILGQNAPGRPTHKRKKLIRIFFAANFWEEYT